MNIEKEFRVGHDLASDVSAFSGVLVAGRPRGVHKKVKGFASGLERDCDHLVGPVGSFVVRSIFVRKQCAVDLLIALVDCRGVGFVLAQTKFETRNQVTFIDGLFLPQ